jgi:phage terminase large subunit-like protein
MIPKGNWTNWLLLAGRGAGKTRTGAEALRQLVCGSTPLAGTDYKRIAIVAETAADARDVMIEGPSGLLAIHPKQFRPTYQPSIRRLTWPNGAVAGIFNAVEPDQLRGPQQSLAWCDELAKWRYPVDTWDNLQFGMRIGDHPKVIITTTPRPLPILKKLIKDPTTFVTRGTTYDNRANLSAAFFETTVTKYEGTRLGRQELNAEFLEDAPGSLWRRDLIDAGRIKPADLPPLRRVVIAIDPSFTSKEKSDECGLIAAGVDAAKHGYILDDRSGVMTPLQWAQVAVEMYRFHKADRIVAEVNNGGDLVENNIKAVDPNVPFRAVHATRGKVIRAEPISTFYEQTPPRVHHVGSFPILEDQMVSFTHDYDRSQHGSPDRMDACLAAGSMVSTDRGLRPIERISSGDQVWTRRGLRTVLRAGMTSPSATTITLSLSNGENLRLTAEHRIYVVGREWISVDALVCGDILQTCKNRPLNSAKNQRRAPVSVAGLSEGRVEPVYNLQVDEEPEFFANGVLVHNCVWALTDLMVTSNNTGILDWYAARVSREKHVNG